MIGSAAALEDAAQEMQSSQRLAIDLEFDKNRFRYGFNLCLMQIAAGDTCFIVDPLAEDVAPHKLFPLLEDPKKEKVVFAFGEDLRLLHALGCRPSGLFELRAASSLLNYPPASLTNLLNDVLNVELQHSAQNSNWYKRPLTDTQVGYAADDVRYLFAFRQVIHEAAEQRGMVHFLEDENAYLSSIDLSGAEDNVLFRKKDKFNHSQYSWAVYERLLYYRESVAREINRPSFQVFHKDFLDDLARDAKAMGKWRDVRGIHRLARKERYKKALANEVEQAHAEAVKAGLSKSMPADPRPDPEEVRKRRTEKSKIDHVRQQIFVPIKKKMVAEFGEHAATFMLSNRAIVDLIAGDNSVLRPYKRDLLKRYARELGVDVSPYV